MKLREILRPDNSDAMKENLEFQLTLMMRYGFSKEEILIFVRDALEEIENVNI